MNPVNVINPLSIFLVAIGGAGGCILRFLAIKAVVRLNPTNFPLGTMVVNILGSFIIGYILTKYGSVGTARAFLVTGMLGGFTTFSAFSWDMMGLLNRGQYGLMALYAGGSVLLSLMAVMLGAAVAK